MKKSSVENVVLSGLSYDMRNIIMSILLLVVMSGIFTHTLHAQNDMTNSTSKISIKDGDEWHYFKGVQKPPHEWMSSGFDHSNWRKGMSGLGYGIDSNRTYLGDMQGNYLTIYARKEFYVSNTDTITGMTLSVLCDGPFIAYLNGIEIIRTNTVQISNPEQSVSTPPAEQFDIGGFAHELFPGNNVLSFECSNDDINSKDFSFNPFFEVFENKGGIK